MKPEDSPNAVDPAKPTSGMLTASERESLRQKAKENAAYFKKAFGHLRPSKTS